MTKRVTTNAGLVLRLYVAKNAPNSVMALANLRAICDTHFAARREPEIIDLLATEARSGQRDHRNPDATEIIADAGATGDRQTQEHASQVLMTLANK
jgi:hypothetical protein